MTQLAGELVPEERRKEEHVERCSRKEGGAPGEGEHKFLTADGRIKW